MPMIRCLINKTRQLNLQDVANKPKTSEFAYFRKVKSNAVHAPSSSLPKVKERLKRSQIGSNTRGPSREFATLRPANKMLKFSDTRGSAELFEHYHFFPEIDASHRLKTEDDADVNKKKYAGPSFVSESVVTHTPVVKSRYSSPANETSCSDFTEKQFPDEGTFSAKRHRLRQWAAQTLSSDGGNLHPKGSDLVSSLMSRLFPKDNRNYDPLGVTGKRSKSPDIHEATNYAIGRNTPHSRDWDKDGRENLNEIVLSERDTSAFRFPSRNYNARIHFRDEEIDLNRHWRNGSSFFIPYERCIYSDPSYLNDTDELLEHARKDRVGFLEWDFRGDGDRAATSIISHDAEKYSHPRFANSWNFEWNEMSEKRRTTRSSSESDYLVMPMFNSDIRGFDFEFGPYLAELEDTTIAEPMQLSLCKPFTSNLAFIDDYMDLNPYKDYRMKSLSALDLYSPSVFRARRFPEIESSSEEAFVGMSPDWYFKF